MDYRIRELRKEEVNLLENFIYEAIFIPDGVKAPPREIINQPEIQIYISEFGKGISDYCLVAQVQEQVVGAVWVRIMNDYGHVDDETPSLAISLYSEYRGHGIGTNLMNEILQSLKNKGCKKVSLAVQKANYAYKMYQKVGFHVIDQNDEEYIMVCDLSKN